MAENSFWTDTGLSRSYFRERLLPAVPRMKHRSVQGTESLDSYEGMQLVFANEGSGELNCNGERYVLKEGSCFLQTSANLCSIEASRKDALQLAILQFTMRTMLYITFAPYADAGLPPMEFMITDFSGEEEERIREILTEISAALAAEKQNDRLVISCLAELTGRFLRSCRR